MIALLMLTGVTGLVDAVSFLGRRGEPVTPPRPADGPIEASH
jgi:hypothetical protein